MRVARMVVSARSIAVLGTVALLCVATAASAFSLRSPQIAFNNSSLQAYLNTVDGGINTLTDQVDAQVWSTGVSGNSTFTLQIELAGNAAQNSIGIYTTSEAAPVLKQIFPGAATAGWFATCHFTATGTVIVTLFDNNAVLQGQTTYPIDRNSFGFYLQGPGGTFYSQDSRNGGTAQMLTYLGTGLNAMEWFEAFEDLGLGATDSDFNDAVLVLESVAPTPVDNKTWGALKAKYR